MSTLPKAKWTRAKLPEPISRRECKQSYKTFVNEVPVVNRERIPLLQRPGDPWSRQGTTGMKADDYCSSDEEYEIEPNASLQNDEDEHLFERSGLRTPPEIRRSILSTMSMNSVEEQAEIELALGGASYDSVR